MGALRWLGAALAVHLLTVPLALAQPSTAPDDPTASEDAGVDVITAAGVNKGPPERKPSIKSERPELQVVWDPGWKRFELGNYIGSGIMAAATIGSLAIPPSEGRWQQTNSFDVRARNALRFDNETGRNAARDASDIMLAASTNLLLVDTLIVAWWGHDAGDAAWEMALMSVEALLFNNAINGLVAAFASRERPYGAELCVGKDDEELTECTSSKRYRSFFSGHSSTTFAVAGLTCMHHSHLPLYGGGLPDILACASAFGVAAGTATLRVVADQHWTSDVLLGAAFGTFSGTFIPWVLHYRTGDLPDAPDPDAISIQVVPTPTGAYVTGAF